MPSKFVVTINGATVLDSVNEKLQAVVIRKNCCYTWVSFINAIL